MKKQIHSLLAFVLLSTAAAQADVAVNEIHYTSSDGAVVTPNRTEGFGAAITSNTYSNGEGVITFDGSVTSIGENAFYACYNLTSITLPETVTSFDGGAFYNCSGLTAFNVPAGVTSINPAALNICQGLTTLTVDANNTKYDSREDCNAIIETSTNTLVAGCKGTTIPTTVTTIGTNAFYGHIYMTDITIPANVTTINSMAFFGIEQLSSVTNLATTPQAMADNVFQGTPAEKTLHVKPGSLSAYQASAWANYFTIVGDAIDPNDPAFTFELTESSVSIYRNQAYTLKTNLPASVDPSLITWSSSAPTTVHVDEYGVVSGLAGGTATITATYGESSATCTVTVSSSYEDGEYSHYYVDGFWYTLNKTAKTASVSYRGSSYSSYSNEYTGDVVILASIRYQGVEYSVTSIGNNTFRDCSNLTSVIIPSGVTNIGDYAFYYCM